MPEKHPIILYRDTDWLVVNKPTGLATHAGQPGELGVVEWLELHLGYETHVVSRLDRGTSGALLLALNPAAASRAQSIHEAGGANKIYEFLSAVDSRRLDLPDAWQTDTPLDDKAAQTRFTRLGSSPDGHWTHYRAEISRGRRHQIRRHARASGLPILGDNQYEGVPFFRLCLHCATLHWPGISVPINAPQPASLRALRGEIDLDPELAVCQDRRDGWTTVVSDAFRAVHRGEISELPAAVDIYGEWFDAVWFDENTPPDRLLPVLDHLGAVYGCRGGVIRTHRRNPHQRGLVTELTIHGESPPDVFTVTEHGLRYEINLLTTQHTGLFLDQRDTRQRLARRADGARLANLFAYTCSFSLVAARHGTEVVFSVDTAKPGLTTGKHNFALNGLDKTGQGKFIQQDARKWLARQLRRQEQDPANWSGFDLMVCDPPVFASAKDGGRFSLVKEWEGLARDCAALLAPGGAAILANNHRTGDHKFYRQTLSDVFATVISLRPPLDFPVFPGQPHHVRTFWCE